MNADPGDPVSASLVSFVSSSIRSVELLDVLMLLRRDPGQVWTVPAITAELRIHPRSAETRVAVLRELGLVRDDERGFAFETASPLVGVVDELDHAYRTRRVRVIELIFARPPEAARRAR